MQFANSYFDGAAFDNVLYPTRIGLKEEDAIKGLQKGEDLVERCKEIQRRVGRIRDLLNARSDLVHFYGRFSDTAGSVSGIGIKLLCLEYQGEFVKRIGESVDALSQINEQMLVQSSEIVDSGGHVDNFSVPLRIEIKVFDRINSVFDLLFGLLGVVDDLLNVVDYFNLGGEE
jgi:hypothetical protein